MPSAGKPKKLVSITPSLTLPVEAIETLLSDDSPQLSEAESNPFHFQAIGTLYGQIQRNEEGKFFISVVSELYPLFIQRNRYRAWLLQYSHSPHTPLFLRVYPKCFIAPQQEPKIYFEAIAWALENRWNESPLIFLIKGVWQFVPQSRTPVLSVYRNREANDPMGKFKASHLPVLMRREDGVNPFRFNPKIPKEQLPKRWFVQGRFRFMANRNCWGWVEDLAVPTEEIPRYRKPVKAEPGSLFSEPKSSQDVAKTTPDEHGGI